MYRSAERVEDADEHQTIEDIDIGQFVQVPHLTLFPAPAVMSTVLSQYETAATSTLRPTIWSFVKGTLGDAMATRCTSRCVSCCVQVPRCTTCRSSYSPGDGFMHHGLRLMSRPVLFRARTTERRKDSSIDRPNLVCLTSGRGHRTSLSESPCRFEPLRDTSQITRSHQPHLLVKSKKHVFISS